MNASGLRFSLARLLAAVLLIAAALAMLIHATPLWADLCSILVVLLFLIAVVAVPYRRGAAQAFWLGFAILGWGYLLIDKTSLLDADVIASAWLERLHTKVRRFAPPAEENTITVLFTSETTVRVDDESVPVDNAVAAIRRSRQKTGREHVAVYIDPSVDPAALREQIATVRNFGRARVAQFTPAVPALNDFVRVGQRLAAIVIALLGGLAGRVFYATRDKQDRPAT
jgi:hypothetical protein